MIKKLTQSRRPGARTELGIKCMLMVKPKFNEELSNFDTLCYADIFTKSKMHHVMLFK